MFATPRGNFDEDLFGFLVIERAKASLQLFLKKHNEQLKSRFPSIHTGLKHLAENQDWPLELAWHTSFCSLNNPFNSCTSEIGRRCALILLRAANYGIAATFNYSSLETFVAEYEGKFYRDVTTIEFDAEKAKANFNDSAHLSDAPHRAIFRNQSTRIGDKTNRDHTISTIPGFLLNLNDYSEIHANFDQTGTESFATRVQAAMDLIDNRAPVFSSWINRVTRQLTPLTCTNPETANSGSSAFNPGCIQVSNTPSIMTMAEMLVHESSHQYLYVLRAYDPLVDPQHSALYFSPFRGCDRPLFFILVAYHAFVNVLLFYKQLLAQQKNASDGALRAITQLTENLNTLEEALSKNENLTNTGSALFLELRRLMHAEPVPQSYS